MLTGMSYGREVDMWSLGVLLFTSLCGEQPFFSEHAGQLLQLVSTAQYSFDPRYWEDVSSDAIDFIQRLLVVDPAARMTAAQALAHPWIASRRGMEEGVTVNREPSASFMGYSFSESDASSEVESEDEM
jgi:serine/threonine protein kinase